MLFIAIIAGVTLFFGLAGIFGGVLKKVMELVSLATKLCVGGFLALLIYNAIPFETSNPWRMLLCVCAGSIVIVAVILVLAGYYRLVGYSINYFINSFLILFIASILGEKTEISFLMYALVLFLVPRIIFISDRFSTVTKYSHKEYSYWNDTETTYYNVKDMDWWENYGNSWKHLPVQIFLAAIFYLAGSATLLGTCPIESKLLTGLYLLLATAVNIAFDFFIFSKIDNTKD